MSKTIATTGEPTVLVSKENGVATITLNRPSAMNSLNQQLLDDFLAALADAGADDAVRVVVLTGAGKAFCAGGDLFYLLSLNTVNAARSFIEQAGGIPTGMANLSKPIIGMINGVAAGAGFSMALACDIVFCAKSVKFGMSFSKVGLVPDCGAQYLLPHVVGPHKAKELMFTADLIDAETASGLGFINRLVPDDKLAAETYAFAQRLVQGPPLPLAMIKKVVNMSGMIDLATTLEIETESQTLCMQTNDNKEGVAAFKEKRAPVFTGK